MIRGMETLTTSQRIMALMTERGMNRADLARKAGIPYQRLNVWFTRENAKPNAADLERVAVAFNVSISYLIAGLEPNPATARDWVFQHYQRLAPDKQKQLEDFVRFLLQQQDDQEQAPDAPLGDP